MVNSILQLTWNEESVEELARHGLDTGQAEDVLLSGQAKRFRQPARPRHSGPSHGTSQPERIKMIGPDNTGRLLTIILEMPDADDRAHIVTGWTASRGERSRYHKPGGRLV